MALPQDPIGRALVQLLARDRYERWLADEIERLLRSGFDEIAKLLITTYADMTPAQQARRLQLLSQVKRHIGKSYSGANKFLQAEMQKFARLESKLAIEQMKGIVAESTADIVLENLTRAEIRAIAEFPIAGLGIGEWFEKQASDMNALTRGQIQLGLLNGESTPAIARRIVKLEPGATFSVMRRARANARTLVRTTTTTVQTQASYETMKSIDPELVSKYRYVAVRDGRTTPICRALDQRVFSFDDPKAKRPPQHVNCRSTIVAVVDYAAVGLNPPNTVSGGFTMGSYAKWLKTRPVGEQNAILGRAGADLFRSERATLAELVDGDGRRLTFKELAELYGT